MSTQTVGKYNCGANKKVLGAHRHDTLDQVKACSAVKMMAVQAPPTPVAAPVITVPPVDPFTIPAGRYATDTNGKVDFWQVRIGKGKWDGYRFVTRLVGHPSDWAKYRVPTSVAKQVLNTLATGSYLDTHGGVDTLLSGPQAAAVRFSRTFTCCAMCLSPLSDPDSIARGLGPDCAKKF